MVKVDIKKDLCLYCDGKLYENIKKMRDTVNTKDMDRVIPVDGTEGSGKSVFAQQLAILLDPTFNIDRMCMTSEEFITAVTSAKKGQAIVFDEAFTGLSSRSSLSGINKLIVSMMMEMRQKNLFVIIVLPTFFLLDKYVAIFRSRELFNIYMYKGKRGFWRVFNSHKKKYLYLRGKKELNYDIKIKPCFKGRFLDKYTIDEQAYRKKKGDALRIKDKNNEPVNKYQHQRDYLINYLNTECGESQTKIAELLTNSGTKIGRTAICSIVSKFNGFNRTMGHSQKSI